MLAIAEAARVHLMALAPLKLPRIEPLRLEPALIGKRVYDSPERSSAVRASLWPRNGG